ncbi:unnamed protein product [Vitrella brassicaformis CCMP3155]|uniref:Uncharacterized protein n=1 Tax=Vitrella brassicaformis (strain CCMP3155) TaxID=1169540 RepID=A0A0G4EUQ5_VITBC|nr:unnamed protein product [Vitrella brassicaformis CCMP3155]|eukprot:CEM02184.1 unnamed protein product [Vitrella brassicaformis CCMP3155]
MPGLSSVLILLLCLLGEVNMVKLAANGTATNASEAAEDTPRYLPDRVVDLPSPAAHVAQELGWTLAQVYAHLPRVEIERRWMNYLLARTTQEFEAEYGLPMTIFEIRNLIEHVLRPSESWKKSHGKRFMFGAFFDKGNNGGADKGDGNDDANGKGPGSSSSSSSGSGGMSSAAGPKGSCVIM